MAIGVCHLELGAFQQALEIFATIKNINPTYTNKGLWYEALTYLRQNEIEKSIVTLNRIPSSSIKYKQAEELMGKLKQAYASLFEKLFSSGTATGQFGFSQSQASKWKKVLCPLLFDTLDSLKMLPLRDAHRVAKALENLGQTKCFQDASERLVDRPQDQDTQQGFFSKKSPHDKEQFDYHPMSICCLSKSYSSRNYARQGHCSPFRAYKCSFKWAII